MQFREQFLIQISWGLFRCKTSLLVKSFSMQKTILGTLIALTLTLFSATVVWSQDFKKGLEAADRGDFATALREWTPLAEQGDAVAQYNLGLMYANGEGVLQDYAMALKWYTLAAEQGDADAQFGLALIYEYGKQGVPMDWKAAEKWLTLAVEQGYANAH